MRRPTDPPRPGPSLENLVGQVVMPRLDGRMPIGGPDYERARQLVLAGSAGGFIVFGGTLEHTPRLLRHLQSLAPIPLMFASDLEEGLGQQVEGAARLPTAMALAAAGDPDLARRAGVETGRAARAAGVGWVLAPVCDVNRNPGNPIINVRAFGDDPAQAGVLAAAFADGVQSHGIAACAKHFPGHGGLDRDSHRDLPLLKLDRAAWEASDLIPFRAALGAGVAALMLGHIAWPALEPRDGVPATLSEAVARRLVRNDLKFRGLLVTDAMDMGALRGAFSEEKASLLALDAGLDLLLHPSDPERLLARLREEALASKAVRMTVEGAGHRVLKFKKEWSARAGLAKPAPEEPDLAGEIARRAMTLLTAAPGLLPLAKGVGGRPCALALADDRQPEGVSRPFEEGLKARAPDLAWLGEWRGRSPDVTPARLREFPRAVVATFSRGRAGRGTAGLGAAERWLEEAGFAEAPAVAVGFGSPYVLKPCARMPAILAAYSECEASQRAAASALFGEFPVRGKCPVEIPGFAARGAGRFWAGL